MSEILCDYCGKKGHKKENCWQKKRDERGEKGGKGDGKGKKGGGKQGEGKGKSPSKGSGKGEKGKEKGKGKSKKKKSKKNKSKKKKRKDSVLTQLRVARASLRLPAKHLPKPLQWLCVLEVKFVF